MQPSIPGYRLTEELHRSARSLVLRGVREADGRAVVVKTIPKEYPEPQDLARLRREHRILGELNLSGVVKALGLVAWENNLALVMEDGGGEPIAAQLGPHEAMPIEAFFKLATAAAHTLAGIHGRVIHKDVNPRNILWNPSTEAVRFIDFGLATEVERERLASPLPRRLVGSLAFISPEQTGRMNRDVDFRTDFYSLGITFYRLLTGHLPFTASDPMEWVHCHITQTAPRPEWMNPRVPRGLGAVVLKLMAKNPEDRYQSAQGLLRDLVTCKERWDESGDVAPFELGRGDVMAQFQVPRRIQDREDEARVILEAFRRTAAGETGLVVVSGAAGIGKSALVADVCKAIVDRNGRFFEGKFDQFQRHGAYAAVAQALAGLVRQVMAEPEERLARLRARILDALGPNGRIAVDLVPELAGVIGQPPPVVSVNPVEEQNRFLATIQGLVGVFARTDQPLVLFFDDLQWCDGPTLLLMRRLLESDARALLIIGAYRDDEVTEGHPLLVAIADIERTRPVQRLQLGPLSEGTLNRIVASALHAEAEETQALSGLIYRKSAGNPFFTGELLRTLHQDGLFVFDHEAGRWRWDLEGVERAKISDDVVDFMISRIQRLPAETQALLKQAACIGDVFDLRLLGKLAHQRLSDIKAAVWPAIAAGLVAPMRPEDMLFLGAQEDTGELEAPCQFLHDRVRQAAYALNTEAERCRMHLQVGRLLLTETPEPARARAAGAIAQQLNEGRALLVDAAERSELITLNLRAARQAKAAAAYRQAFEFAHVAKELLPVGAWGTHFDLAFEVFVLHASCAYLSGATEVADAGYAELLTATSSPLQRAEIHAMRAAQYTFANRMDLAIAEGLEGLALLGIQLSAKPGLAVVGRELALTKLAQRGRKATDFDDAPLLGDRSVRLAMKLLDGFLEPAYLMGNETLFAATVLKQATLSMRHGNCSESVSAYAGYCVLLAGLGDMQGAHAFGQLALRLMEKFGHFDSKCRTFVLYGLFGMSWTESWSQLEAWFKEAVEAGLQSGEFLMMAYACGYVHLWDPGVDLRTAVDEGRKYLALCKQTTYTNALDAFQLVHQLWLGLRGETDGPLSLSDAHFDEAACLRRMVETHYVSGTAIHALCHMQLAAFNGAWEVGWRSLQEAERVIKALAGSPYMVEFCVYGFVIAAQTATAGGPDAQAARRRARRFHHQMRRWARHCPANFAHHARLMEAELARLGGRTLLAQNRYDEAIVAARQSGFVRYEALANESAARFYRGLGLDRVAAAYMQGARDGYMRWGALAKVRALDALLPAAGGPAPVSSGLVALDLEHLERFNLGGVPQLVESGMLDLSTVWKATQAISSEATFEGLLVKLMAIVKESAGAQRAVLVLSDAEDGLPRLVVQAESPESGPPTLLQAEPLEQHPALPVSLIRYVARSQSSVVLADAGASGPYAQDPYIRASQPRSAVAMPIVNQGLLLGVLYLENHLLTDAFTPEHLSVLQILAGQAAVSLKNVRAAERAAYMEAERNVKDTYARELEVRVDERTAELRQAYHKLMELDRLKTNFLSVVSHELRTPLTTIQGYSEFLEDRLGGELTPDQEEYVRHIQQGAFHLRRLVDDLLDFARVEAGSFKLVSVHANLTDALSSALDGLMPLFQEHGLKLETHFPDGAVWAHADPVRLSQVLLNLVGNAIKFTPKGGTIRVSLASVGAELRVEVADSGIGIRPEHLPRLFQKFYQVDSSTTRETGGVGLGLSIAQSIIEAHGGRIGVDSVLGKGSTFWFMLPQGAEPTASAIAPGGAAEAGKARLGE